MCQGARLWRNMTYWLIKPVQNIWKFFIYFNIGHISNFINFCVSFTPDGFRILLWSPCCQRQSVTGHFPVRRGLKKENPVKSKLAIRNFKIVLNAAGYATAKDAWLEASWFNCDRHNIYELYHIFSNLTQCPIYDISISPSYVTSTNFKLLDL